MVREEEIKDITLEDVDLAIRILEAFIRKVEKAKYVLRRVQRFVGYSRRNEIMSLAELFTMRIAESRARKHEEYPEETEITEEDLEKFRKLKEKIEKKEIKPVS